MTHPPASDAEPAGRRRDILEHTVGFWLAALLLLGATQGAVPVLGPLIAAGGLLVGALGASTFARVRYARPPAEAAAMAPTDRTPVATTPAEAALDPAASPAQGTGAELKRLRHDARGHLVPAMLCAERLRGHADPAVAKAADTILASLDRTTAVLTGKADPATATLSP